MSSVADRRRGEVVAAARELVARGGLEALTFGALEKQLPFTRGVITWHFADKQALLQAVLESAAADVDAETAAGVDLEAPFEAQVGAVLRTKVNGFLAHLEATRVLVAFWSDPATRDVTAPLFQRWRRQGARLVEAAKVKGEAAASVDPEAFGALLVALVVGVVVQVAYAGPIDAEAALALAIRAAAAGAAD